MKILLISDTHGLDKKTEKILKQYPNFDYKIHCGDSEGSAEYIKERFDYAVAGNNDFNDLPTEIFLKIKFFRILITHSHLLAFNRFKPQKELYCVAKKNNCNVVFYGHTHIVSDVNYKDVRLINPGSIYAPRSDVGPSFMEVTVTDDHLETLVCRIKF